MKKSALDFLKPTEYGAFYKGYLEKVHEEDLTVGLLRSQEGFMGFLATLPHSKMNHSYAPGKWSVAELVQHVIDTERVLAYRALCFARNEQTPLPGFDQDAYAAHMKRDLWRIDDLISEYKTTRNATRTMFMGFNNVLLCRIGIASGTPMSTRAAGYTIIGHQEHHLNILRERY